MDRDKLEIIERRARIRCNLIRKAFEWARGLGSRVTANLKDPMPEEILISGAM